MGIEETQKLVKILTDDIIGLMQVDFEKVIAEMKELDAMEKLRFMAIIGESFVKLLIAAQSTGAKAALEAFVEK